LSKKIYCLGEMMYQFNLQTCLMGGGERWFFDFTNLLKQSGYEIEIYQFSFDEISVRYKNMRIKGLGNIRRGSPNIIEDYKAGYNKFNELANSNNADGIFYLSMNLCIDTPKLPTLSVSHGLVFDGILPGQTNFDYYRNTQMYRRWIRNADKIISVDTNSIKVMQVCDPILSEKMTYIPNYVDINKFTPDDSWCNTDKFRVLSARRLQWSRGYTYMMETTEELMKKYNDIEVTFCGVGTKRENEFFMNWYNNQDKNKVKYEHVDMSGMPIVYKNAEISVVPSQMAEGTSLSCLEGLATGLPQIVTWVGGLPDLVLQGYNGILIPPKSTEALLEAIEYLYNNRDVLKQMRTNAIATSKAFSKERWEKDILKVVKEVYGD
jgi:glycosyltransferase involved in cell wall biosynthesis